MVHAVSSRRFSVSDYYRMADAGILGPGDRVELLDGEVVEMSPIGARHAACVRRTADALARKAGRKAIVSVQNPVRLGARSEPQPDIALLRRREDFYKARHPGAGDVILLVEVSDTSVGVDREVKLPLYARAGVQELWIADLEADRVERFWDPFGGAWRSRRAYGRGEGIPLPAPLGGALPVGNVLG